jgi:hypothetical protein
MNVQIVYAYIEINKYSVVYVVLMNEKLSTDNRLTINGIQRGSQIVLF